MVDKNKILILTQTNPETDTMFKNWIYNGLNADVIFKDVPKPLRAIRRIWTNSLLPFLSIWLGNWVNDLKKYDVVILHASEWTSRLPKFIHKLKPSMRIIYWYWNPVNRLSSPYKVSDSNVEFWTFDSHDARKYHMKKNIQYYSGYSVRKASEIKWDVYFIGHDKGRGLYINDLKKKMSILGIKTNIKLISNSDFVPYYKVCEDIACSRAILEINQSGQAGYTLRALESLFFKKKLITNNKMIINEPFYCKENIFILGRDELASLTKFINSPYNDKFDNLRKEYDVNTWINNFFK